MLWIKIGNSKDIALYEISKTELEDIIEQERSGTNDKVFEFLEWEDYKLFNVIGDEDLIQLWEFDNWFNDLDYDTQHKIAAYYSYYKNKKFDTQYKYILPDELEKFVVFNNEEEDNKDSIYAYKMLFKRYDVTENNYDLIDKEKMLEKAIEENIIYECDYDRFDYIYFKTK